MLRLVVLSAPRQALVRGRGGSRFAARGHSGSQVLRRAPHVARLAADGLKTGLAFQTKRAARSGFCRFLSSLATAPFLRCETEGSVDVPKTRLRAKRIPANWSSTASPNLAFLSKAQPTNRNFQRLETRQRARLASVLKAHAAASAAEARSTTILQKQVVCSSQWSGTRSAHAYVKRQSCCHAPARPRLAAPYGPAGTRHDATRVRGTPDSQLLTVEPPQHNTTRARRRQRWPSRSSRSRRPAP